MLSVFRKLVHPSTHSDHQTDSTKQNPIKDSEKLKPVTQEKFEQMRNTAQGYVKATRELEGLKQEKEKHIEEKSKHVEEKKSILKELEKSDKHAIVQAFFLSICVKTLPTDEDKFFTDYLSDGSITIEVDQKTNTPYLKLNSLNAHMAYHKDNKDLPKLNLVFFKNQFSSDCLKNFAKDLAKIDSVKSIGIDASMENSKELKDCNVKVVVVKPK